MTIHTTSAESPRGEDSGALAEVFAGFAEHRADGYAPFTAALARRFATEPKLLAIADAARPGQSRPDLLLACVQALALDLCDADPAHPVVSAYARAAAFPADHAADSASEPRTPPLLTDVGYVVDHALDQRDALAELVSTRTVQTNEIGRVAYLYPGLVAARAHAPTNTLALIEIGASAGLNLLLDQYRIHYRHDNGHVHTVDPAPSRRNDPGEIPTVTCDLKGPSNPPLTPPLHAGAGIGTRIGLDLHPLDARIEADRRWLRALVWPEHMLRRARLEQALRTAAAPGAPHPRVHRGDAVQSLAPLLEGIGDDEHPVVMHTAVLAHMTPEAREQFTERLLEASGDREISWLAAEPRPDRDPRRLRLTRLRGGRLIDEVPLAAYHPHGATLTWERNSRGGHSKLAQAPH